MKQFLRDYFSFNRRERNGVFVLLSLILVLILYLSFADFFFTREKTDFSKFEKEIADFEAVQKQISDSLSARNNYFTSFNTLDADSAERFSFNPNNLPEEDWKRLGLSDKQIKTIKNYESKGGKFRTKEDVKKMYCITPELYASLKPYIQIPENETPAFKKSEHQPSTINHQPLFVELNSADTTSLKTLKGIGSAFSKRIVAFREKLGGFVKKEQLMEVYGFDM
ncbi:MAG: helix-hairpin-helix domain-containing protein [Bacteroidetes bacterium]|nr:helix-hairpin-helix domain-containing protein [Bacteroidota bacterium]